MERDEAISLLTELLKDMEIMREKNLALEQATLKRQNFLINFQTKLDVFDAAHKDIYISEKIGPEPVRPKGLLKLALPVYLVKKSQFEKALTEYRKQYTLAEKAYCFDYQSTRAELQIAAEQETKDAVAAVDAEYQRAHQAYKDVASRVSGNTIISEKYKNSEILSAIIDYLRDGRADTLKEAINLWHDEDRKRIEMEREEEHRSEMLRLERERLMAAQEAAEYQRMAYYAAQAASESAKEAADEAHHLSYDISYATWDDDT